MKTMSRLIYVEVALAVALVTLGFMALFVFFDVVEEIQYVGSHASQGYDLIKAMIYVTLLLPTHLYELLPIAVLIGTIFVMARLAQSSEFTILRTSGLGPWRALRTMLWIGSAFATMTFVLGDYISPASDRTAQLLKAQYTGRIAGVQSGAWLKERQAQSQFSVNISNMSADGQLRGVRIFEFDSQGFLKSTLQAVKAEVNLDESWTLHQVQKISFPIVKNEKASMVRSAIPSMRWPNQISAEMVSTALLKPERMRTLDLFRYIQHLNANDQSSQKFEIEFWRKVFYPLSCLVMAVLALPFAYLHFRSGSIAGFVFVGVVAGISFFLLNNMFGYMGALHNWQPMLAAALPGLVYTVISLTAFTWLVLRR